MRPPISALLTVLLLAACPVNARAQSSFATALTLLHEGEMVFVTDLQDVETSGPLLRITPESIAISVQNTARSWTVPAVRRIERRGDPIKNGVITGLIAGAAAGLAYGLLVSPALEAEAVEPAGVVAGLTALNAGLGAGLGALIDAAVVGRTTVFRR